MLGDEHEVVLRDLLANDSLHGRKVISDMFLHLLLELVPIGIL